MSVPFFGFIPIASLIYWGSIAALGFLVVIALDIRFAKQPTSHGSAGWLNFWDAYLGGLFRPGGFLLGDWIGNLPVFARFYHAITFGPTGSGKGSTAILPNALRRDHLFLIDPGGENCAVAIKDWRARGLDVQIINPAGLHLEAPWSLPQMGFNPLSAIDPESMSLASDAKVMAEMLITRSGKEAGGGKFFIDAATTMLRGMIVHIVTHEPTERRSLSTLNGYLNASGREWEDLLEAMGSNDAAGGLVIRAANTMARREAQAPEEFSGIMSTAQEALSWLDDPMMTAVLNGSEVDFSRLKRAEGAVVALVLPLEYIRTHAALTRLVLACAVLSLQRGKAARSPVLFVLDEAAAMGRIEALPDWLVTMRKYRAQFWTIFQNLGQLKRLYPGEWGDFLANCCVRQFLAVEDLETAKTVHEVLGETTARSVSTNGRGEKSFSEIRRPLMTPDELRRLDADQQIIIYRNLRPIRITKTVYSDRPENLGRFHVNPFYEAIPPRRELDGAVLKGRFLLAAGFVLAPHPVMSLVYLGALALGAYELLSMF